MKIGDIVNKTLKDFFPDSIANSLHGVYSIRFELGGSLPNGTQERVDNVVKRAFEIYRQTIGDDDILIVVEEYTDDFWDSDGKNKKHLYSLIDESKIQRFHGPFEQIYYEEDEYGNKKECVTAEPLECDLLVGRFSKREIDSKEIIKGIANLEMGIEPSIPQDVTFFAPSLTNGFRIYDDRGCDIWSMDKELLRPIYKNLNDWILDYNRKEIDEMFK